MNKLNGIVVDLDLCVGCLACEVACKQENNVPANIKYIQVAAIGPMKLNGKMRIDFLPIITDTCTLCEHRIKEGLEPRCVDNCPVEALKFVGDTSELLSLINSGKRTQVCKLKYDLSAYA